MKAVIPAAGLGTRVLPATKAIPKELLTLVDKPMIQYVCEEAAAAGIDEIVVVTSSDKPALEAHFRTAQALERELERKGKHDLLEAVQAPERLATFTFVTQTEPRGLGHAVWCARDAVGEEPFCVLLPDELFGGPTLLEALAATHERFEAPVIAVMEMPPDEISNYGVVDPEPVSADVVKMKDFVEKPPADRAPSNLGSIGRYVLTPQVMDALASTEPGAGGEIQLTDAVAAAARAKEAYAYIWRGPRRDAGRPLGYVEAIVELALEHPEIGAEFRAYLEGLR